MKKSVITLLIFLIMIISVSAVSAADDATDLGASDDTIVSVDNTDVAVAADGDAKNFTDLSTDIAGDTSGDKELGSNYIRNATETGSIAINVDKTIDGKGSIIDANGTGTIFTIAANKEVTLKDMTLKNANIAIQNSGTLILNNVKFINCTGGSINSTGTLTVTNCNFEDYGIAFAGTTLYLSGNTFNNATKPFVTLTAGTLATTSTVNTTGVKGNTWKDVNYTVTVKDDNGNLIAVDGWTVKVGDATSSTTDATGTVEATNFGSQQITATNAKLTTPANEFGSVTVTPDAKVPTIQAEFSTGTTDNIQWNDTFNLTVSITESDLYKLGTNTYYPTSTFTININGVPTAVPVNATTGKAVYEFKNIAKGNYAINYKYDGDDVYQATESVIIPSFTVAAKKIVADDITVNVNQEQYGTQVIDIIFPEGATGFITANITGAVKNLTSESFNGQASINTNLEASDDAYILNIAYEPDSNSNYAAFTGVTKDVKISKLPTTVLISVENCTYGDSVSVNITLAEGVAKATYTLKIGTDVVKTETVNLTKGAATIALGKIAAAEYTINVTSADDNYTVKSNSTNFKVAPATPTVTIVVIDDPVLFKEGKVNVTVSDANATGNVKLIVNNVDGETKELTNGTASFTLTYDQAGSNNITAVFTSTNGNISGKTVEKIFNIDKLTPTINVTADRVYIGNSATIKVTVQEGASTAPKGNVAITIGSQTYFGDLDAGVANVNIPAEDIAEVKEYTANVVYNPNGDVNYVTNSTVFKFSVTKYDVEITINPITNVSVGTATDIVIKANASDFLNNFTVVIKDANNQVVVTNSTVLTTADTTITNKLPMGVYTAEVSYAGDNKYYANSTTSNKFSVAGVIENLTIEIKDATYPAQPIAIVNASVDGQYNVTVNNKNYTVTVSGGTGSVTIDALAAKDGYEAKVINIMEKYGEKQNTTTFNVNKGTVTNATFTITDVTYPGTALVTVESDVDGNYTIVSKSGLDLGSNDKVSVVNGTGNLTLNSIGVGKYTFALKGVADNENYTNNVQIGETKQLTVSAGTVDVNLTVVDVNYPNNASVIINTTVGGFQYNITVYNSTGAVKFTKLVTPETNVSLPTEVTEQLIPGTYTVNVTATITNYNDVALTQTFNVNKGVILYNVTVADYTYGDTGKTIAFATSVNGVNDGYAIYLLAGDENITNYTTKVAGTFDLPELAAGTYTVKVVPFTNDTAFTYYDYAESNTTTFTVNPKAAEFTIEVLSVQYPNNVTVKVLTSNFDGNYTVKVGDITKEFAVTTTGGEVNITDLPVNGYIAYVTSNNANYTVVTKTATFSVNYGPITPTVADITVAYLEQPVVVVESSAAGQYTVTVNGKDYNVTVANGKGNVTIDDVLYADKVYTIGLAATIQDYVPYVNETIAKITVTQANVGLSIVVENATYPDVSKATVFANVSGIYSIAVDGVVVANATIDTTPGVIAKTTVDLKAYGYSAVGYTATVDVAKVDGNFSVTPATTTFKVNQATPVIIIDVPATSEIYSNLTVKVTVENAVGINKFKIKSDLVSGDGVEITINGTTGNYTIENVDKFGTHVIYVVYDVENGNFTKNSMNQSTVEITKITPVLNITDNNATFNDVAKVNITFDNLKDGAVIGGKIIIADVGNTDVRGNNNYTFELGKLTAGVHVLNITFIGNNYYNDVNKLYELKINKLTPVVTVTAVNGGTYPDNATVTFTSDVAGDFIITVINAEGTVVKTIEGINATANTAKTVAIEGLSGGKYTANVTYVENENYTSVTNTSAVFEIAKAPTTVEATVSPATYPNGATVVVKAGQAGTYTIAVTQAGASVYNATGALAAGENTITLDALPAGDYDYTFTYTSDDYAAAPVSGNFSVAKGIPTITIEGSATYPAAASVTITSNADGAYTVIMGTTPVGEGNFTAGQAVVIDLGVLGAGAHDIAVSYAGNANFNATTATGVVTVAKGTPVITITADTQVIDKNATLTITIPGATGNNVTIEGKVIPLTDGVATYNIGVLKAQEYAFTVNYDGDANLNAGYNNLTFTVVNYKLSGNDITVIYSGSATYKVLVTLDGVAVPNATVSIVFNGATKQVTTDANGYATYTFKANVAPKTSYTITATFNGVKTTNKVKVTHVVKPYNKVVKKSSKVTKVKVTLKKVNGKYLAKKTIKVKFRGKTYSVKTNSKGIAYWKVTKSMVSKLKVGKKYTYKATYGKDSVSKKLTIKK